MTEELKKYKDSVLKIKLEISEWQSKAKLLKSFTIEKLNFLQNHRKLRKKDCAYCKETNMIKSDLVQLASKYNKLFAEYPKTKNILNDARKDLLSNKNTTESTVKCINALYVI